MKQGKISQSVCNRSVLKHVKKNQNEIKSGTGQKTDCALFSCQTVTFPISETLLMRHAIHAAVNDLAARGCMAETLLCAVTLPERVREVKLSQMMAEAAEICTQLGIRLEGGHTLVSDSVLCPVVTVTAGGAKIFLTDRNPHSYADYDLLLTKYIGMEAASLIAHTRETELLSRFPKALVEEAKGFETELSVLPEAQAGAKSGDVLMQDVREGGIFASLWELAQQCGAGLAVDLKKIPMKQTVVEICNFYDLNPYEILSTGCLLIAAKDGELLGQQLRGQGVMAAVIGRLTDGNDRVILNGEETRYLDLPKPDQSRKLLNMEQFLSSKRLR